VFEDVDSDVFRECYFVVVINFIMLTILFKFPWDEYMSFLRTLCIVYFKEWLIEVHPMFYFDTIQCVF